MGCKYLILFFSDGPSKFLGPVLSRGGKSPEICNENLTEEQSRLGKEEFTKFVEETVQGMIRLENNVRGDESSSLQVFCRVDVGVLKDPDGCYHYYVNELERSLTVGLYRSLSSTTWTMLNSAVGLIPAYIERSSARK